MRFTKKILAGTISAMLLAGAPSAFAQSSGQQGYSTPGGAVQTQIQSGGGGNSPGDSTSATPPARVTESRDNGKLPFTGLDLVLVVGAGGVLLALGVGMRRLSRSTGVA